MTRRLRANAHHDMNDLFDVARADLEAMLAFIVATEASAEAMDMPERLRLKTLLRGYLGKDKPNG